MSKLLYPNDGIYTYCKVHIESCANHLSQAISSCNFNIPEDFVYRNYLNNLDNVARDYYREISSINSRMLKTNNNFKTLSSDLKTNAKKMTTGKIKDRDRMIL